MGSPLRNMVVEHAAQGNVGGQPTGALHSCRPEDCIPDMRERIAAGLAMCCCCCCLPFNSREMPRQGNGSQATLQGAKVQVVNHSSTPTATPFPCGVSNGHQPQSPWLPLHGPTFLLESLAQGQGLQRPGRKGGEGVGGGGHTWRCCGRAQRRWGWGSGWGFRSRLRFCDRSGTCAMAQDVLSHCSLSCPGPLPMNTCTVG